MIIGFDEIEMVKQTSSKWCSVAVNNIRYLLAKLIRKKVNEISVETMSVYGTVELG
jgi:hypothetical protein